MAKGFSSFYTGALADASASYGDILKAYQDRQVNLTNQLDFLGQNELQANADQFTSRGRAVDQSAVQHGLGNTTVRNSLQAGNAMLQQRGAERINNDIRAQRLGIQTQLSGETLGYAVGQAARDRQYGLEQQRMSLQERQLAQQDQQFQASLSNQRYQFDHPRGQLALGGAVGGYGGGHGGGGGGLSGGGGGSWLSQAGHAGQVGPGGTLYPWVPPSNWNGYGINPNIARPGPSTTNLGGDEENWINPGEPGWDTIDDGGM